MDTSIRQRSKLRVMRIFFLLFQAHMGVLLYLLSSGILGLELFQSILIQIWLEKTMNITFSPDAAPDFLKLLAHDLRWKILTLLAHSDYYGQEFIRLLGQPQNLVSYHLRKLHEQHLVTEHRSTADERSIYYSLDLDTVRFLYQGAGVALHPALGVREEPPSMPEVQPADPPLRVLFLCTENSARSQMAEALLRHLSHGRIEAYSAGSRPTSVHPLAQQVLEARSIDTAVLRAKSIDVFAEQAFDAIVTVCDRVRESCPSFPGDPECIHWSLVDPARVQGSLEERMLAFEQTALQLTTRLRFLLLLLEHTRGR
jgi:ArsR family transcriptional regulator, arsenate/arsenite/antimonite-responsive transcriptional repressor / arsenate reductase (thioredoxin)